MQYRRDIICIRNINSFANKVLKQFMNKPTRRVSFKYKRYFNIIILNDISCFFLKKLYSRKITVI